jgi:Spy/CpxP family protein refolding chaperone
MQRNAAARSNAVRFHLIDRSVTMPHPLRVSTLVLPALLLAGMSLPVLADPPASGGDPPMMAAYGHGHRQAPPFARALRQVGLTTDQQSQIRQLVQSDRGALREQFQSLRASRLAFDRAVPGTGDFANAQANLLQAEMAALQARLQHEADLHTRIYALLTDAQKAKLASVLAQMQTRLAGEAAPDAPPPEAP